MSKLHHSETGRIVATLGEELTTYRRARKTLQLPRTNESGRLYVLARSHAGNDLPLRLAANGSELPSLRPSPGPGYQWYEVIIPTASLRAGDNIFEFWCDATAMNAWSLAIEGGHAVPGSFTSDDGGATWRNSQMCYLNVLDGEYAARIRLGEGEDPAAPALVLEDPANPRLAHLRQLLPPDALQPGPIVPRLRALSGWLSTSWQHSNTARGSVYTPWDAETILAWGGPHVGHDGRMPIAMCVHYGVAFVLSCQAAGIPARCVIGAYSVGTPEGHFVGEAWSDEHRKWVLVDPNLDAMFFSNGVPMSGLEVQEGAPNLERYVAWGPGTTWQRRYPPISEFIRTNYLEGKWVRHLAIWPRADFLSRPALTPPNHGSLAYCETGMVWQTHDRDEGFGMFPHFASAEYFCVSPV